MHPIRVIRVLWLGRPSHTMPHDHWLLPRPDPTEVAALSRALNVGAPAARVLVHRGLGEPAAARRFLNPAIDDLHDPLTLRDMPAAVARIARAIRENENILI